MKLHAVSGTEQERSKNAWEALTVSIAVMRGNLLANTYMLDDAKRNIPSLAEELYVVVTIVLFDEMIKCHAEQGGRVKTK